MFQSSSVIKVSLETSKAMVASFRSQAYIDYSVVHQWLISTVLLDNQCQVSCMTVESLNFGGKEVGTEIEVSTSRQGNKCVSSGR